MTDNPLPRPGKYSRARFYAAPFVVLCILVVAVLLKTGLIPQQNLYYALLIPSVLELLLIILLIINISAMIKSYRTLKRSGYSTADACQKTLEVISSPRMARLATLEPRLYYALYLSYRRGTAHKRAYGSRQDSYAFLVKVLIFLCLLEVIAVTILLPQRWLIWKLVHMILGLWAVIFLWSDYRAISLYGHRISLEGIKLRLGLRCSQDIAWEDIDTVRKISQTAPGGMMGPGAPKNQPGVFYVGLGDVSNLEISLREPQNIQAMVNEVPAISRLLLSLENPDAFIAALRSFRPGLCE